MYLLAIWIPSLENYSGPLPFFLTFICIYFLWHLFPGHKFLYLQFLLGYLFVLCNLFWFRKNMVFFQLRLTSMWQGELMYGLIRPWALEVLRALFTWMYSITRESTSKPSSSALLSAFLSMYSKTSTLLLGHQPCVQPVWPVHTCQLHHCNDGMVYIASLKWPPSDTWWLFGYAHP